MMFNAYFDVMFGVMFFHNIIILNSRTISDINFKSKLFLVSISRILFDQINVFNLKYNFGQIMKTVISI